MSEKQRKSGFIPQIDADAGILRVDLLKDGEIIGSESFDIKDLEGSPVYKHWQLQALFTTLSARVSQLAGLEKLAGMRFTHDLWCEGEWAPPRKGGPRTIPIEIEAVAKVAECTIEEARSYWKALDSSQQKAHLESPELAQAIEEIREARDSAEEVDLTEFFSIDT